MIAGKDHDLGPYGSVESRELYGRLIVQNASGIAPKPKTMMPQVESVLIVQEVVLALLLHAKKHYGQDGRQTSEYQWYTSRIPKRDVTTP